MLGKLPTPKTQLPTPKARLLTRTSVVLMWGVGICLLGASELEVGRWKLSAAQSTPGAEQIVFRLIIVSTADKAAQVLEQLKGGADFSKLAQTESLDPSAFPGWSDRSDRVVGASRGSAGGVAHVARRRHERRAAAAHRLCDCAARRAVLVQLAHARQRGACGFGRQRRQVHAQRGRLLRSRNGTEQPREARGLESEPASHLRVPTASR